MVPYVACLSKAGAMLWKKQDNNKKAVNGRFIIQVKLTNKSAGLMQSKAKSQKQRP